MKYYRLCLLDQPKTSWVLHDIVKPLPKRKNPQMPSAFYKFFPPPDVDVHMKARYQPLCCPKCGRYDSDKVFEAGFEEPVAVRFKQDIAWTNDRQLVLNDKCNDVLKEAKTDGYKTKPIGKSGWHVLRVTSRVDSAQDACEVVGPSCDACGEPKAAGGALWRENQIAAPTTSNTLFTSKTGLPSSRFKDRDAFLTEDVYKVLKNGKIKGPYCERLQSDVEVAKGQEMRQKGVAWTPPGMTVYLSGK